MFPKLLSNHCRKLTALSQRYLRNSCFSLTVCQQNLRATCQRIDQTRIRYKKHLMISHQGAITLAMYSLQESLLLYNYSTKLAKVNSFIIKSKTCHFKHFYVNLKNIKIFIVVSTFWKLKYDYNALCIGNIFLTSYFGPCWLISTADGKFTSKGCFHQKILNIGQKLLFRHIHHDVKKLNDFYHSKRPSFSVSYC